MEPTFSLAGKTALITGAGQGVGRQIALTFAGAGARVVVNDYFADRADSVAREIGSMAIAISSDVSDYDDVGTMVERIEAEAGGVDILVNNAGNAGPRHDMSELPSFWETDPADWQRWMATNLYGVMNASRHVMAQMVAKDRGGRLITIVSDAGRVGEPHLAAYSAAKAGAAALMRSLAKAGGRYGITANSISLGGMKTPGVEAMISDPAVLKRTLSHYVIRRLGEPTDAAGVALLLASEAGGWITGQTYPVNGGYTFAT